MHLRRFLAIALALPLAACNTTGKKPRLPQAAVVGTWRSDTMRTVDSSARLFQLRMLPDGMAEFTSEVIGSTTTKERGTWDGADSLVRVVVRGDNLGRRPTSILLAVRGGALSLTEFDTAAWGPQGMTLRRR
jgi:hypothetical protein